MPRSAPGTVLLEAARIEGLGAGLVRTQATLPARGLRMLNLRESGGPVPSVARLKSADRLRDSPAEETMLVAGSIAAARALYERDQMGVGTLWKNAYMGGVGYQSPEEIAQSLQDIALSDPQVKKALIDGSYGGFDPKTASGRQRLELLSDRLKTHQMQQRASKLPPTGGGQGYMAP